MALTETGLSIKRLPDIVSELEESLKLELGEDLDLSSDSLLGIINSIYAAALADQWAVSQAVYDAFNIDTAQGKQLDDLVSLVGITRLGASPTNGNIEFSGDVNTTITNGSLFSDNSGNIYTNPQDITISLTDCTSVTILPSNLVDSTDYTLSVNTDSYTVNSGIGATAESVTASFVASIGQQAEYTATKNDAGDNLIISSNTVLDTLAISLASDLIPTEVTSIGEVENTVNGDIPALANTIINVNTPIAGLNSVNNPAALILGREEESDEELRVRQRSSVQIAGKATVPAIESALAQVQGVTQAIVIENRTTETDINGRPAKSYEVVVEGGNDSDIAEAIWDTKPAGVETYGSITESIIDGQGNTQSINFSRPANQYIWCKVEYSLYDEESFPSGGEDTIKQAIADFGNSLDLGNDVIPKRFYGTIYSSVSGLENITVDMASSGTDANSEPAIGLFNEDPIDIDGVQVPSFDISRIELTLV